MVAWHFKADYMCNGGSLDDYCNQCVELTTGSTNYISPGCYVNTQILCRDHVNSSQYLENFCSNTTVCSLSDTYEINDACNFILLRFSLKNRKEKKRKIMNKLLSVFLFHKNTFVLRMEYYK